MSGLSPGQLKIVWGAPAVLKSLRDWEREDTMKRESRELLAKPPLTARLREYAAENEGQVRRVLSFIVGLLCARGRVLGGFAPFEIGRAHV